MEILDLPIFLASGSPRRKQLLEAAGFTAVRQQAVPVEEIYPDDLTAAEVAPYLARLKMRASSSYLRDGEIALTADSIVVYKNQILGKPQDRDDARRTLSELSGEPHIVYSGVCLKREELEKTLVSATQVHFYPLSEREIDYYVDTYRPWDKAGSYGIQEWIGHCRVHSIQGSYNNVIGLPTALVYETLKRHFI